MCADRALLSIGGIVNHLHNCDKIIYRPDSHNLLCRNFARDATPLVIIADEAPQVCLIICANWNFEREYFVPLDRLVFLVFRFTLGKVLLLLPEIGCSNTFNAFLPIVLDTRCYSCVLLRSTKFERNGSSSPLYAIHPGRTIVIQPVGFNSCSFTDVTVKLNRTGNIPRREPQRLDLNQ